MNIWFRVLGVSSNLFFRVLGVEGLGCKHGPQDGGAS